MIISKQNAKIKEVRSLSDKKFRDEYGKFVIEGFKLVGEVLSSSYKVDYILLSKKAEGKFSYPLGSVEVCSDEVFDYASESVSPEGVLAVVYKPQNEFFMPKGNCLFLDGVSDPANVGAIIRTAAAAGYTDIYASNTADVFNNKSVRASMGGLFKVNIYYGEKDFILDNIGIPLIVADMDGENVYEFNAPEKFCLCIGNEANGVSEEVILRAEKKVSIPMKNNVESLNAAVSSGILMYLLNKK